MNGDKLLLASLCVRSDLRATKNRVETKSCSSAGRMPTSWNPAKAANDTISLITLRETLLVAETGGHTYNVGGANQPLRFDLSPVL